MITATQEAQADALDALLEQMPELAPYDEYNRELARHTHPPTWVNPAPADRYNLVVVGAGTAGLVAAAGAAGVGAKVALVERRLMGGDCLNFGCVPSKALIRAARAAAEVRSAGEHGVRVPDGVSVDFPAVMERMRRLRAEIAPHDSVERFASLGIDVFIGNAAFTGPDTLEVGDTTLRFARACIATGARPVSPPIKGLQEAGFHTNETIFTLTELPERFVVVGSGPIGCELAQSFARFGSRVTVIEMDDRILPREDRDAAQYVYDSMLRDGVEFRFSSKLVRVERSDGAKSLVIETPTGEDRIEADELLLGVGRAPNVEGMGLEVAGVKFDTKTGVEVDDRLRTANKRIYAAGDVCSKYKFTHTADAMARIVIQNAMFFGRARASGLRIPWCTFTDPEIAHTGIYEHEAKEQGVETETIKIDLDSLDRAKLDGDTGVLKIVFRKGGDKILGATLVAPHAGEMISEITLAMKNGIGLKKLASVIHPYPTQAEIFKRAGDTFNKSRLTPGVKWLFERFLAWRR